MEKKLLQRVHIGTSGWSYKDWVGPFYAEGTTASEYLRHYATRFDAVEVDSTFYAIPAARNVEGWMQNTPDHFRFALKIPGIVTHGAEGQRPVPEKVLLDEEGKLNAFFDVVEPLATKISCLVFQFPYFRVKEMQAQLFMDRLASTLSRLPGDFRFAVEIRNKPWLTKDYTQLLSEHKVAAVMIDHPYMPPAKQQLELGLVTTDFAYVRLLGDRYAIEKKTKQWGKIVEDKSSRLKSWAEVIRSIVEHRGVSAAYAFSNNHFAGHGPETSRQLWDLVAGA